MLSFRKKLIQQWRKIFPSLKMQRAFAVMSGMAAGLFLLIFHISNAASYLSDEPETCINCHIMRPEYISWQHNSHGRVATCNDCHVPHENIIRKYYFKATDGLRHSAMFTLKLEPQVIKIHEPGKTVVQENCLRCHIDLVNPVSIAAINGNNYKHGEGKLCWDCHREVPHGRVHSLSSTPNGITPSLQPVLGK